MRHDAPLRKGDWLQLTLIVVGLLVLLVAVVFGQAPSVQTVNAIQDAHIDNLTFRIERLESLSEKVTWALIADFIAHTINIADQRRRRGATK